MLVECRSIKDFLTNLEGENVYRNRIYVDVSRDEVTEHRWLVVFQVSAVVVLEDEGQYLLQAGQLCGYDYADQGQEQKGTIEANFLMEDLGDYCDTHSLTIRPGKVGF